MEIKFLQEKGHRGLMERNSELKLGINTVSMNWHWNTMKLHKLLMMLDIDGIDLVIDANQNIGELQKNLSNYSILALGGIVQKNKFLADSLLMDDSEFFDQIKWFNLKLKIAFALQSKALSLSIDPWVSISLDKAYSLFFERIEMLADLAAKYNITLNLEYISPRVARLNGDKKEILFCPNLQYAIGLIQKINKPNVKLLLDSLHWYVDDGSINQNVSVENIGFVHICDYNELNRDKISDQSRILPFQGVLPIRIFLDMLMTRGYSNPITIEVFCNKSYPNIEQIALSLTQLRHMLLKG